MKIRVRVLLSSLLHLRRHNLKEHFFLHTILFQLKIKRFLADSACSWIHKTSWEPHYIWTHLLQRQKSDILSYIRLFSFFFLGDNISIKAPSPTSFSFNWMQKWRLNSEVAKSLGSRLPTSPSSWIHKTVVRHSFHLLTCSQTGISSWEPSPSQSVLSKGQAAARENRCHGCSEKELYVHAVIVQVLVPHQPGS